MKNIRESAESTVSVMSYDYTVTDVLEIAIKGTIGLIGGATAGAVTEVAAPSEGAKIVTVGYLGGIAGVAKAFRDIHKRNGNI